MSLQNSGRQNREWSSYQKLIFSELKNGTGNIQVDAFAGCGKTSTICEGMYHLPPSRSITMCAFNKSIKDELSSRVPDYVNVQTLHSMGFAALRNSSKNIVVDDNKIFDHIKAIAGDSDEVRQNIGVYKKTIGLAKNMMSNSREDIADIVDSFEIDSGEIDRDTFIDQCLAIFISSRKQINRIDYDDMVYLPVFYKMPFKKFGTVFVDECQDLSPVQIELAMRSCTNNGRIITIGDQFQALYAFRGADSNAINNIVTRLNSKRMELSITYRCAKNIVIAAQQYVPGIQYAPNAKDGIVANIDSDKILSMIRPGDYLISRTNAPLISWCLSLLKEKIPANILGRDIAQNLLTMIKKSKAKDLDGFFEWLKDWREKEVNRLSKLDKDTTPANDRFDCIVALSEGCKTLEEVANTINLLFSDKSEKNIVTLSTIHKIKGKEADRAFVLDHTIFSSKKSGQKDKNENRNLRYVAYTRPKNELYIVTK